MPASSRDPFGFHPHYFDRRTGVSSDSLHHFDATTPDPVTVTEYLAFGECWRTDATFFADIGRVASTASFGEVELVDRPANLLVKEAWEQLVGAVERAVGDSSEVVVSLSGGLDSPALAAAAVELYGRDRVRGVTSGCTDDFEDPEPIFARMVAEHLGIEWSFVCADRTDLMVDWPDERIWPCDPLSAAKAEWDALMPGEDGVILWGLGGDSLQRGDHAHYRRRLKQGVGRALGDVWNAFVHGHRPGFGMRRERRPPTFERPSWMMRDAPGFDDVATLRSEVIPSWRRGIDELHAPVWSYCFEAEAPQNTRRPHHYVYPFFDEPLAKFWASVPTIPWSIDKELMRAVLRDRVPETVRLRPKSPVAGEPLVTVTAEAAERMQRAVATVVADRYFDADVVASRLTAGVHPWTALEPFVRCASVARWLDIIG